VAVGVSELRLKRQDGSFRASCHTASSRGVLVFHAFVKKTRRTPPLEIELARRRLKELLDRDPERQSGTRIERSPCVRLWTKAD
jgi:phage-related protein